MKKKILYLSPFNKEISFNRVSRNMLKFFLDKYRDDFEVYLYSIYCIDNQTEDIKKGLHNELNISLDNIYTIEPLIKASDNEFDNKYVLYYMTGCYNLHNIIRETNPDFIFILCDLWLIKIIVNHINKIRNEWKGKLYPYIPIDLTNMNDEILDFKADKIITTNDYTTNEILKVKPKTEIYKLPHLILNDYYKITDENIIIKIKKSLFGEKNYNKFIIGAINANSIRKRWDIALDAFFKFYKTNKNTILVIKTNLLNYRNSNEHSQGFFLDNLIKYNILKYNIKEDMNNIIHIITNNLTNKEMNELYNSVDIFINATDGEGFGLTPFEAGKAGKVTILPNHSTFNSFYKKYNFNFLINTVKLPLCYIRDNDNLETLLSGNNYFCVYKSNDSYINKKPKYTNNKLYISNNISTIFVTNNSSDQLENNYNPIPNLKLFHHVKTLNKAFDIIDKAETLPNRFQILISSHLNIIEESYYTLKRKYYDYCNKKQYRDILIVEPSVFKNYTINGLNCELITSDGIYNKLLFYFNNKNILTNEENEISKIITEKLNIDLLTDKFKELFN